jgi:hypothetical protein
MELTLRAILPELNSRPCLDTCGTLKRSSGDSPTLAWRPDLPSLLSSSRSPPVMVLEGWKRLPQVVRIVFGGEVRVEEQDWDRVGSSVSRAGFVVRGQGRKMFEERDRLNNQRKGGRSFGGAWCGFGAARKIRGLAGQGGRVGG